MIGIEDSVQDREEHSLEIQHLVDDEEKNNEVPDKFDITGIGGAEIKQMYGYGVVTAVLIPLAVVLGITTVWWAGLICGIISAFTALRWGLIYNSEGICRITFDQDRIRIASRKGEEEILFTELEDMKIVALDIEYTDAATRMIELGIKTHGQRRIHISLAEFQAGDDAGCALLMNCHLSIESQRQKLMKETKLLSDWYRWWRNDDLLLVNLEF